ncbi:sugar ABC transporter permease [Rhizobium sp. LC145]|jgi:inositol-phosphate transport system permease protein|uniref:carbohydrate ABC transporter permease n=1 Tax=Rhizobium sp. LC145 TaxID=1120688 RepID=UPI00062A4522|nr:sugar ABC transporter permease [Rhizobium sp. LC145]KKX27118.1 ABC transporter permease [Rhizobium sp. LC145]TKT56565.1 sugar ABC transporter permease [Rhizobiaceae bacterium LC148]
MRTSRTLGLVMIAPAAIMILLFYLMPVILTGVFSMTNMSTATGISGGAFQVTQGAVNRLRTEMPEIADAISEPRFVIDEAGIAAVEAAGLASAIAAELRTEHLGEVHASRREAERMIKALKERPSTRQTKQISDFFNRSVINTRFESREALMEGLKKLGVTLTPEQQEAMARATYTGWVWTTDNFRVIGNSPDMAQVFVNTAFYVAVTLLLFNVGYALFLAVTTHYMPATTASIFRAIWLLPRITPVVIYVLMWKWLTWDSGFISMFMGQFGHPPKNYLLDSAYNAWFFVILINGFIGASMGMLVFSSAIKAIPEAQFHASEVDGASRWQQIRYIILPQLRWPILFVTCYQTLSLLASFNEILLSTRGGPGRATEVWSLAAYHTALQNYTGNLEYGLGAAMALVLVVIGVILSLIYLRVFRYDTLISKPLIED